MGNIYFSSDTHFSHDRDFIWGARGFKNVTEMNEQIVKNTAVPNNGDYKYWYMIQQLVNFTSNQGLKDFVNKNKDKEMRNVWKV